MTHIRRWVLPGVLAALVVGMLTYSAVRWSERGVDTDPGMLVTAREQARNFFTLDYRHADADVDRVLALSTGKFRREYAASRDAVVAGVEQKKLMVTASIPKDGSAVELVDGNHGQVLVAVDVTTSIAGASGSSQDRNRTRITLTKVKGRWLVSDITKVG